MSLIFHELVSHARKCTHLILRTKVMIHYCWLLVGTETTKLHHERKSSDTLLYFLLSKTSSYESVIYLYIWFFLFFFFVHSLFIYLFLLPFPYTPTRQMYHFQTSWSIQAFVLQLNSPFSTLVLCLQTTWLQKMMNTKPLTHKKTLSYV